MPSFVAKATACDRSSWKVELMPKTTKPVGRYCCQAASMAGISSLHGEHHEAQTLMSTGRPRSSERASGSLSEVERVKSGAVKPWRGAWIERLPALVALRAIQTPPRASRITEKMVNFDALIGDASLRWMRGRVKRWLR